MSGASFVVSEDQQLDFSTPGFYADVTMNEQHTLEAQVTDHNIEAGGVVNDHIILQPRRLELTSLATNTPIQFLAGARSPALGIFSAPNSGSRAELVWELLKEYWQGGAILTVYTSLEVYESMVITNVGVPRTAQLANALEFSCSLKQVVFVDSELTAALQQQPAASRPKKRTPKPAAASVAEKAEAVRNQSLLVSLLGG